MPRRRAHSPSFDPIADSLSQDRGEEARLSADPAIKRAVERGKRWEAARQAASEASARYCVALDKLIKGHPKGWPADSELTRQRDSLVRAIARAESKAYQEHGFIPRKVPKSPAELLTRLHAIQLDGQFDLQEAANRPWPTDFLWEEAEWLIHLNPFLPPLPERPDDGRKRYAALARWCEAIGDTRESKGDGPVKARKQKGGRPGLSATERELRDQLVADWNRAKESRIGQKDFCGDRGIDLRELTRAINWKAQQRRRGGGAA